MSRSHGRCIYFLRNCQTVFQSGCTVSMLTNSTHFYSSTFSQKFVITRLLIFKYITYTEQHLIIILVCIFIITLDIEYFIMCLFPVLIFTLISMLHSKYFIFFKKLFYLFIFRQRGRVGEKGREKHQCVIASHVPRTGDLALNPGMCPDWESNWRPFDLQPSLNPLSYTSQGENIFF